MVFLGEVGVLLLHAPLENILVIWGDDNSGQGLESLGVYDLRAGGELCGGTPAETGGELCGGTPAETGRELCGGTCTPAETRGLGFRGLI